MEAVAVIIPRRGINDEGKGKKYALKKLISAATTQYVWLRDDDVRFETDASVPFENLHAADLWILPLKMSAGNGTLLQRLQQVEYTAIQSLTLWAAEKGHSIMCSGANLIVSRERWLESYNDLHPEIPSGDDMFLLESFKRRNLTIKTLTEEQYIGTIQPQSTLQALLKQRMRWAGKAPKYKDKEILICGAITLILNLFLWLLPVFILKYAIDLYLIHKGQKKYHLMPQQNLPWLLALLLEILYPIYVLISLLGGLFRQSKW